MSEESVTSKPIFLNEVSIDKVLNESSVPVLFEFYASWCHHCMTLAPVIDEVAGEMAGEIVIGLINCDIDQVLRKRYKVNAVPTLFLAKEGKVLGTTVNPQTKEILVSWIRDTLANA